MKERHWLNTDKDGGSGFIITKGSEIKIGDCNKMIALDFYIEDGKYFDEKAADNVEYKIDLLFDVVKRYRQHTKKLLKKLRKEHEKRKASEK